MLRDIGILSAKEWDNWTSENKKSCLRVFEIIHPWNTSGYRPLGHGVGIGTGRSIIASRKVMVKIKFAIIIRMNGKILGSSHLGSWCH